ncbi:hypothetical protein HK101_003092 [Irineochytrium annulatum]|nr:hypothetical protein HK101_003092 [Irineochytrium annulatum]
MVPPPTHDADRTDPPPSSPWPAQRNPDIPTPSSPRPHQSISPPQPAANPFTTLATSRPHAVAGGRPNRPAISWDHATSLRDVEEAEEGAPRDVRELERDRDREERERQRGTAVGAPVARREDQGPLDPFSDSYRAEQQQFDGEGGGVGGIEGELLLGVRCDDGSTESGQVLPE